MKPENKNKNKVIILPLEENFLSNAFKIRETLTSVDLVNEVYKSKKNKLSFYQQYIRKNSKTTFLFRNFFDVVVSFSKFSDLRGPVWLP